MTMTFHFRVKALKAEAATNIRLVSSTIVISVVSTFNIALVFLNLYAMLLFIVKSSRQCDTEIIINSRIAQESRENDAVEAVRREACVIRRTYGAHDTVDTTQHDAPTTVL